MIVVLEDNSEYVGLLYRDTQSFGQDFKFCEDGKFDNCNELLNQVLNGIKTGETPEKTVLIVDGTLDYKKEGDGKEGNGFDLLKTALGSLNRQELKNIRDFMLVVLHPGSYEYLTESFRPYKDLTKFLTENRFRYTEYPKIASDLSSLFQEIREFLGIQPPIRGEKALF